MGINLSTNAKLTNCNQREAHGSKHTAVNVAIDNMSLSTTRRDMTEIQTISPIAADNYDSRR